MQDYKEHEFEDDQLPPSAIHEQLKAHDKRMKHGREDLAQAKAFYMTRWWKHIRGRADERQMRTLNTDVEVNRLWGAVGSYLSALYPRANRVVFGPDVLGRGDPQKAQLALNKWLSSQKVHTRIMSALRQSILYPGCAAKVGYSPGNNSPLERVWLRVIPWWEVVLDSDATDVEDERFRGHVYYRPLRDVEREYNIPKGLLSGTTRKDFLSQNSDADPSSDVRSDNKVNDGSTFVRVLEICNLKDNAKDPNDPTVEYPGRFEVYVLNQGDLSKTPIFMGPLPLAEASGAALAHIEPLIFAAEPEFPLRGIAGSSRMLPQLREINIYRSFMAQSTRRDSRQYLMRDGVLGADTETKLMEGVDGLTLKVPSDYNGPLSEVMQKIETGSISPNVINYMSLAENDLERAIGTSPNARGVVTKATAFEVQTTQLYTESEFGLHSMIKDAWLAQVVKLATRALLAAMQNPDEGSLGEYDDTRQVALSSNEAMPIDQSKPDPKQALQTIAADIRGSVAPFLAGPPKYSGPSGNSVNIEQEVLNLVDELNKPVPVTVADLDANFVIDFVEGGRTPMTDAAMQQNLMALMQPYMALWQQAQDKGPMGVMARTYMKSIAERFELPKDLHPDQLEQKAKSQAEQEPTQPQPPGPEAPPQPPVPEAPPAPPEEEEEVPPQEELEQEPPGMEPPGMETEDPTQYLEQAVGALDLLLQAELPPEVLDVLAAAREAAAEALSEPEDAREEIEEALAELGKFADANIPEDFRAVLDEVANNLDEALSLLAPEGEDEEYVEGEEEPEEEGEACPVATQNIEVNLQNRQKAIDTANYGPANPGEPGDYFDMMAAQWGVPVAEAESMRCGNCAAFIVTPKMIQCIQSGLAEGDTQQDAYDVVVQGELGYCEAFDFKCAASRTCRAWIAGGPVTEEK